MIGESHGRFNDNLATNVPDDVFGLMDPILVFRPGASLRLFSKVRSGLYPDEVGLMKACPGHDVLCRVLIDLAEERPHYWGLYER
jgi:hypothetical protein